MNEPDETADASRSGDRARRRAARPGLVIVFAGGAPEYQPMALGDGVEIGRGRVGSVELEDSRMSRRHAAVGRIKGRWQVRDLGSKNGTWLDGRRVEGFALADAPQVIRAGDTLLIAVEDIEPYQARRLRVNEGVVLGPAMSQLWDEIADVARGQSVLHITGPTGVGKELAARYFHQSGPQAAGPFVAVNCATLVPSLAERLLFGTRRGAYSGADVDAPGHFQAADGGTLFLDEINELPREVQPKLLRVLETREVTPLGAVRPVRVDVRVCSATLRQLDAAVEAGEFREDLYFRLGRPALALPELRRRPEELPWLAAQSLARVDRALTAHVSLIEAMLGRPWPGNVRALLSEATSAARLARREGTNAVKAAHLSPTAGYLQRETAAGAGEVPSRKATAVLAVLEQQQGNVAGTARALGMHRTQLRRLLTQLGIDPKSFRDS